MPSNKTLEMLQQETFERARRIWDNNHIFLRLVLYRLFHGADERLARLIVMLAALMVRPIYFLHAIRTTQLRCYFLCDVM